MDEFGERGKKYKKRAGDMKKLTSIYNKQQTGEELSREDLRFLYELDGPIEGFGYERDPRIEELLEKRNRADDLKEIFCYGTTPPLLWYDAAAGEWPDNTALLLGNLTITNETSLPEHLSYIDGHVVIEGYGIDQVVAIKLIEAGQGWAVAENLHRFNLSEKDKQILGL